MFGRSFEFIFGLIFGGCAIDEAAAGVVQDEMEGAGEAAADGAADVMEDMLVDDMDIAGGDLDAGGDLGVDVGGDLGGDMGGDMMTENLTAGAGENDDAEEETAAQLAQLAQQRQAPTAWAQDGLGALAYRTGAGASSVGTTKGQS